MASPTTLVQLALKELGADAPTTQSILRLAATLAQTINRWPGLSGKEKLEMVLKTLREVLEMEAIRGKLSAQEAAILRATVDTVVPETLTLLVAAGRGEIDLRKPTPGCAAALCGFLCRSGAAIAIAATSQEPASQTAAPVKEDPPKESVQVAAVELAPVVPQ